MAHQLVLSLFPGIDLFGRGFESEGFCVVRGPDLITGGDIRQFEAPPRRFDGVIAGPPCQGFSKLHRAPGREKSLAYSVKMLQECLRVIGQAKPDWFLIENVPTVPGVSLPPYTVQRFDCVGTEFGLAQKRRRHFQFGARTKTRALIIPRKFTRPVTVAPAVTASEGKHAGRRDWPTVCELMGVTTLRLPGMTRAARYKALGNGVPVPMAAAIARAIKVWRDTPEDQWFGSPRPCKCGCGRELIGDEESAGPACRKRLERARRGYVVKLGTVTALGEGGEP